LKVEKLNLPYDLQWDLFNHTIVPILLYGSEVWGFESCEIIDVFQRKFLKQQLRFKRSTPNCMVYGDTGQIKLSLTAESRMLMFWFKIAYSSDQTKFTHALYKLMLQLHERQEIDFKWGAKVKSLLDGYGFGGLWAPENNPGVSLEWFRSAISLRIQDVFKQNWWADVWESSSCLNYRMFKTDHRMESNLVILEKRHVEVIHKFRCANFPLPVHKKPSHTHLQASNECPLCKNDVGDEFHYLFICPVLNASRKELLPKYYYTNPNAIKFQEIMCSKKRRILKSLAIFLLVIKSKLS